MKHADTLKQELRQLSDAELDRRLKTQLSFLNQQAVTIGEGLWKSRSAGEGYIHSVASAGQAVHLLENELSRREGGVWARLDGAWSQLEAGPKVAIGGVAIFAVLGWWFGWREVTGGR